MRIGRLEGKRKPAHHGEPVILFAAGDYTFACPAAAVDEIRALDGLEPVSVGFAQSRLSRVKFTLRRDGKTYYIVDANLHFRIPASRAARLVLLRDARVGVLVDSIDRMAEIAAVHPLPRAFRGEERQWFSGLAMIGDNVVPVVNPAAFLTKAELAVAEADAAKSRAVSA